MTLIRDNQLNAIGRVKGDWRERRYRTRDREKEPNESIRLKSSVNCNYIGERNEII